MRGKPVPKFLGFAMRACLARGRFRTFTWRVKRAYSLLLSLVSQLLRWPHLRSHRPFLDVTFLRKHACIRDKGA